MVPGIKIIDLIKQSETFSFSFEVSPGITEEVINNLEVEPKFFAVTWHAKTHKCKDLDIEPLRKAIFLRSKQQNVLLHLSCDLLRKPYLDDLITLLQAHGICNLFIVLGEGYDPSTSDFQNSSELIKYIKEKSGNYFCIGTAGFLESSEERIIQLKEKIAIGADFIMTQAFFEVSLFSAFLEKCKKADINVPVLPGIYAFENYTQLDKFINLCKVKVSSDVLEKVKNNIDGVELTKNLIRSIYSDLNCTHFHFFSLNNLGGTIHLIKQLQF
ncbi:methylenetetrahydrofolate reductase [Manduca sexta]|uniref:methylenetetrahydrofolate reductase n=1 Tax=Manduca sexta TaxID=7130 RepID=UPI00188DC868|nr:methylenetetrahydrofolate reductase [Manduca sexta]